MFRERLKQAKQALSGGQHGAAGGGASQNEYSEQAYAEYQMQDGAAAAAPGDVAQTEEEAEDASGQVSAEDSAQEKLRKESEERRKKWKLTQGDYMVQVGIVEARSLCGMYALNLGRIRGTGLELGCKGTSCPVVSHPKFADCDLTHYMGNSTAYTYTNCKPLNLKQPTRFHNRARYWWTTEQTVEFYFAVLYELVSREQHTPTRRSGSGDTSDPVCKVTCLHQSKCTKFHKKTLDPFFDETLYFEFRKLEPDEVETGKIRISVCDHNTITRDTCIGVYEVDMALVYFSEDHELHRQWVGLFDPKLKRKGIQGYLKISVAVLGPGDEPKAHDDEDDEDDDLDFGMVLMPPVVTQRFYQLEVRLFAAHSLPRMDSMRSGCDPMVVVSFGGVKMKSHRRKGQNVEFNEKLLLPVAEPLLGDYVKVQVQDWDRGSKNDVIATSYVSYVDLKRHGVIRPHWIHLYGAPAQHNEKGPAAKMNAGVLEGTTYRGKLLLECRLKEEPKPKLDRSGCGVLPENSLPAEVEYVLQVDVYEGTDMVSHLGKLHVEISIGSVHLATREVPVDKGTCSWYTTFTESAVRAWCSKLANRSALRT